MIRASVTCSGIDYPVTFHTVIPRLADRLGDRDSENLFYRFIGRTDGRATRLFLSVLDGMSDELLDAILLAMAERYGGTIAEQVNASLKKHALTKNISVGRVAVERGERTGSFRLVLEELDVRYENLLKNPMIREKIDASRPWLEEKIDTGLDKAIPRLEEKVSQSLEQKAPGLKGKVGGKLGGWLKSVATGERVNAAIDRMMDHSNSQWLSLGIGLMHNSLDKRCVQLLEIAEVKQALLDRAAAALGELGVALCWDDITFSFDEGRRFGDARAAGPRAADLMDADLLPPETRRAVAEAFVRCLQSNLKSDEEGAARHVQR